MKTTFKLTLLLFLTILSISCNTKSQSTRKTESGVINVVAPSEFKEKSLNQTIVDIRTPQEFKEGHIEGAVNINFFNQNFLDQFSDFDKSKPIFIYCRSGNRTTPASTKISNLGFTQIYDLDGGILNWIKSNNETIK